jgi:hypothetical protein
MFLVISDRFLEDNIIVALNQLGFEIKQSPTGPSVYTFYKNGVYAGVSYCNTNDCEDRKFILHDLFNSHYNGAIIPKEDLKRMLKMKAFW